MTYLNYTFRFIIFWIVYFLVNRIFFALFFIEEIGAASSKEILTILPKSIPLDISFISYLLVPIVVLIWINFLLKKQVFISKIIYGLVGFFILLTGLIAGGEVALYSEWQTKLNFTALSHFINPAEVFKTASIGHIFTNVLFIVISLVFIRIYRKKVQGDLLIIKTKNSLKKFALSLIVLPFLLGILLLGIRGGFQPIPVNLSDAYFSNKIILNDIAVNPNWNILQSILKNKSSFEGNPYEKYTSNECESFISELYVNKDSASISVINSDYPNIVFIILESWSADNIESLGGLKGITPNFKELEKEGLLFKEFYSNGYKSDQGMSSIFSSFPVFPNASIINQADKFRKLPCLNKSLATKGYHSSYFFGGQLTYGNIKGYLLSQGFDIVKDENDYQHLSSGALGVHDEFMFTQFIEELKQLPEPFMSTLFTISSHSPYDFPGEHLLSFNHKEDKYVNSVAYTDKYLGEFMKNVRFESWYKNTLFIIVSDHSHNSPMNRRVAQKEKFHIPMLWYGEVIKTKFKGISWDKVCSHIDISPTILKQLEIQQPSEFFGVDALNYLHKGFAPYSFIRGYGMIRKSSNYAYSINYQKPLEEKFEQDNDIIKKESEIFMQYSFQKYLKY